MKYMQTGSFQSHPLMRLTLSLTLVFLIGFVATNFALYFSKMSLDPQSVVRYYNGSEEEFHPARSAESMLEVTHGHLPMMALVLLLLTHLVIFTPFSRGAKIAFIVVPFLAGLLNESSSWLVRFVAPGFAWLKVGAFITLQGSLILLLVMLGVFLLRSRNGAQVKPAEPSSTEQQGGSDGQTAFSSSALPMPTEPRRSSAEDALPDGNLITKRKTSGD